jgi:hypothetical protein
LGRGLFPEEIESIKVPMADRIGWHDAISDSINEKFNHFHYAIYYPIDITIPFMDDQRASYLLAIS